MSGISGDMAGGRDGAPEGQRAAISEARCSHQALSPGLSPLSVPPPHQGVWGCRGH